MLAEYIPPDPQARMNMMNRQIDSNYPRSAIANPKLLQFMLRVQHIARQEPDADRGYAMMMTTIISIAIFSLLASYLVVTNITRQATAAFVNGSSTFYAAESGLNARADLIRQKVGNYAIPTGTSATGIDECWNAPATSPVQYELASGINDFGCKNYVFKSNSGTAASRVVGKNGSLSAVETRTPDNYVATTYVVNNPDRLATYPNQSVIPAGQLFAGMRMLEYTHRIYSTARTQQVDGSLSPPDRTVLQMDFQTRFVPIFQFAAFYEQDLEITPGPNMYLNGRIHTNGNLHLTSNNTLCIAGQVSASGGIYNRRKHAGSADEQVSNGLVYIYPSSVNCSPTLTQLGTNQLFNKVTYSENGSYPYTSDAANFDSTNAANMNARFGSNVVDRVDKIEVPAPSFLAKSSGGEFSYYYAKADLRIEAKSNPAIGNDIFFNVTALATGMGDGSMCTGLDIASDRMNRSTLKCQKFLAGQLHSLRQPVLVRTGQSTDDTQLCTAELTGVTPASSTAITALTAAKKQQVARALQTAIVSQREVVNYGDLKVKLLSDFPEIKTLFGNYLTQAGITTVTATDFNTSSLASIAAIAGNCFKPAPIQTYLTFYNNRERANLTANPSGGNIAMLQTNIESLTIWNRDGLYVNLVVDASGDPVLNSGKYQVQTNGHNSGQGNSSREQIFKLAPIPSSLATCNAIDDFNLCKKSFQHLGLAAADTSEGGLVFHLTVDANNGVGTTTPYPAQRSPYGFAITGGRQLPGPLTISTDQAAYIQGDFNFSAGTGNVGNGFNSLTASATNPKTSVPWTIAELASTPVNSGGYKFPAAILSDSLNVTSNACLDGNAQLNCGVVGATPPIPPVATSTTINAAFLGGSDIMPFATASALDPNAGNNYSGGLQNYPRFHEDWGGKSLNYRGSFVSLGAPLQVSGTWQQQQPFYSPPTRNWDYDTDFDNVTTLPPLTPNVVYLKQRVFSRGH
jgi:hypothetical protein